MVVVAGQAGLSISETADLLGFSCTTVFAVWDPTVVWDDKKVTDCYHECAADKFP